MKITDERETQKKKKNGNKDRKEQGGGSFRERVTAK